MPRKPARPCRIPGCPNGQDCNEHTPTPWVASRRKERVSSGWQQQRDNARILRTHQYRCHVCGQIGAMQVDHVIALAEGGEDTDENKRPIHKTPCHAAKTAAEAARARSRRG